MSCVNGVYDCGHMSELSMSDCGHMSVLSLSDSGHMSVAMSEKRE